MKVLLTGATGFIGAQVTRCLVERGADVCAVVRPGTDRWRIADIAGKLRFIEADLGDRTAVRLAVDRARPRASIQMAGSTDPGAYRQSLANVDHLAYSLDLATALLSCGCHRLVVIGTDQEYAASSDPLRESDPVEARNLYAAAKLALLSILARLPDLELAWLRLFNVFGPAENPRRLVPYVIRSLLEGDPAEVTEGTQVRDFMHVSDVAAAIVALALSDQAGIFNVASGSPVQVREVCERIGMLVGRPELIRYGARRMGHDEPAVVAANVDRLRTSLGWRPRFDLETGLRDAVEWWRERPTASAAVRSSGPGSGVDLKGEG